MVRSRLACFRSFYLIQLGFGTLLSACAPALPDGPFQGDHGATAVKPPAPSPTTRAVATPTTDTSASGLSVPHNPTTTPSTSGVDGPPAPIVFRSGWARPTPPGAPAGAVYGELHHPGPGGAHIVGADTPNAEVVEIHESAETGGMMTMRPLPDGLRLAAGETRTLAPGGLHLMLIGLRAPLIAGETLPLRLRLADGSIAHLSILIADSAPSTQADGG